MPPSPFTCLCRPPNGKLKKAHFLSDTPGDVKKNMAEKDDPIEIKSELVEQVDNSIDEPLQTNEDAHLTLKQSLKKWRRVAIYSLCMTSAILMYGYDYVIVGTVSAMPSFQCVLSRLLLPHLILVDHTNTTPSQT